MPKANRCLDPNLRRYYNTDSYKQADPDLLLNGGREKSMDRGMFRAAVNHALPEIRSPGAVTLANLARIINTGSKCPGMADLIKPLSGKHLQKLLGQHQIDSIEIKKTHQAAVD